MLSRWRNVQASRRVHRSTNHTVPALAPSGLSWSTVFWILHLFPGYLCFSLGLHFLLERGERDSFAGIGFLVCWCGFAVVAAVLERQNVRRFRARCQ